jgi:aryl-alcohol dehydrogenase-like predicted oxidoreductase
MERELGATGVKVYPVGWGVMPLSTAGRPDEAAAMKVFQAALEIGVTFWDTANSYCLEEREIGHNERLIAKALKRFGGAGRIRVATKGGMTRPGGAWVQNGRPAHLRKACEQSLRDLGVETIFLYQFHWPDPKVPYAESIGALAELQWEGKIRHIGVSNVSPALLEEALGIVRVESVQNLCNPFHAQDLSNGLLELCARHRLTYIPYRPVGGAAGNRELAHRRLLDELARTHGVSAYQVILAWLLGKGAQVVPIPGASRESSLRDSAAAVGLTLAPEEVRRIEALGSGP